MTNTSAKILCFAGSARSASLNKKLAKLAQSVATQAGIAATFVDLKDYPMPLYDGDLEEREGIPAPAAAFKKLLIEHPAFVIACPEYNSSITPLLKNAIDWATRPVPGEPSLIAFKHKCILLLSASPGALGGLRGLAHVRNILGNIGALLLADQMAVPKATDAFNEDGSFKDAKQTKMLEEAIVKLAKLQEVAKLL